MADVLETFIYFYDAAASAPMAQELSLLGFFILGFVLFRSEAMKTLLGRQSEGKSYGAAAHTTCSVQQLRGFLDDRQYEQVIDSWPMLDSFTPEALSTVVTALLALDRSDDVGLFIAKAAVNLPHLRPSFHQTIDAIVHPACEVPRQRILAALQDVYLQSGEALDTKASLALLLAFAKANDEHSVNDMLKLLNKKDEPVPLEILETVLRAFLSCQNVNAALGHLQKVLDLSGPSASQELILSVARAVVEKVMSEEPSSEAELARSNIQDLLSVLESSKSECVEALTLVLLTVTRHSSHDAALADRAAKRLCALQAEASLPVSTFDALIRAQLLAGRAEKAVKFFSDMVELHPQLSEPVLLGLLTACESQKDSAVVEHMYCWARSNGRCSGLLVSATVTALASAKQLKRACEIFEEADTDGPLLDPSVCKQLARCATEASRPELARRIMAKCPDEGIGHDEETVASRMRGCSQKSTAAGTVKMLECSRRSGLGVVDTATGNSALDNAVAAGDHAAAHRLFKEMQECNSLDVVSYNILLKLYVGQKSGALVQGNFDMAWRTIETMERNGPGIDAYTVSILFKGYKTQRQSMEPEHFDRAVNLLVRHSIKVDEVLVNVILEACVGLRDFRRLNNVLGIFKRCGWNMPKRCSANTYSALIKAYGSTNQMSKAIKLWEDITKEQEIVPSEQMFAQMIDVLVSCGRLDEALKRFQEMKDTHPDRLNSAGFAIAYAMIIKGFAQQKDCERALQFYQEMKVLDVQVGVVVLNTLIDACCRVGDMERAAGIFRDMAGADVIADLITYSTLIKGYCVKGDLDEALQLFGAMRRKGIKPDAIVFNSLLDGCARKEMPWLCEQVVNDMIDAGVQPSNYSASILIKLYGRIADLDAAFKVLHEMPKKFGFRPNQAVYTTLMSSCTWNGRIDLAMNLRLQMLKDGQIPDEKTYSTLLRGAMRSGHCEHLATLLSEAVEHGQSAERQLLEDDVAQNALRTIMKRKGWVQRGGDELVKRLQSAGYNVHSPQGPAQEARGNASLAHGRRRSSGAWQK